MLQLHESYSEIQQKEIKPQSICIQRINEPNNKWNHELKHFDVAQCKFTSSFIKYTGIDEHTNLKITKTNGHKHKTRNHKNHTIIYNKRK